MKTSLWTLVALLMASSLARADILFIDVNNSKEEVAKAYEAALQRGEKLIVIPKVREELQERLAEAEKQLASAKRSERSACSGGSSSSAQCQEAKRAVSSATARLKEVEKKLPQLNAKNFKNVLSKLNRSGVRLSSIIISGHDGNRLYYGRLGELNEREIEAAFKANPEICESVQSFYFWGCYTATTDDFIRGWKSACPNASMIAGFIGQSPASIRPESGRHLKQLLLKEAEFLQTRDKKKLETLFNSLDDAKNLKSAICLDRDVIVSRKGVSTVKDEVAACFNLDDKEKQKHFEIFNCYREARPGCESVPNDLNRGPLRRVYDFFQETSHCARAFDEYNKQFPDNPLTWPTTPYAVRRILFDNNVRKNFEKLHKRELEDFNKLLDELGVDPSVRVRNLARMNRKQHLDMIRALQREFRRLEPGARDSNGKWVDDRVLAMGYYINELIKVEKGECIPLSWVEEGENLTESRCKIKLNMRYAREKARAVVADEE